MCTTRSLSCQVSTREKACVYNVEYQALPSFRGVAHEDGCLHLPYTSSWKFHQLATGQLLSGQPLRYGKGGRYGPSITFKITPTGSLFSSSQAGRRVGPALYVAFGLIGQYSENHLPGAEAWPIHIMGDVSWDPKRRRAWAS